MRQHLLSIVIALIFAAGASAQDNGCDGKRYLDDVFTNVKMTSVKYATTKSYANQTIEIQANVYTPEGDAATERPVVILAHGGSFIFGDLTLMDRWCRIFAKKGYVTATIQYRLYPVFQLGYPDSTDIMDAAFKAVSDMKAAVRYFREDAAGANVFKIDPNNIFIGGYSAGAVTALHAAYTDDNDGVPAFLETLIQGNGGYNGNSGSAANQSFSSDVRGVLSMSGGIYRAKWLEEGEVPLISIHGTADATVPYTAGLAAGLAYLEGSGSIHTEAAKEGIQNYLETVPGGGHTDIYDKAQFAGQVDSWVFQASKMMFEITCGTVGTEDDAADFSKNQNWSVFPNPGSGAFNVRLPEGVQSARFELLNSVGQRVFFKNNVQNGELIQLAPGTGRGVFVARLSDENQAAKPFPVLKVVVE